MSTSYNDISKILREQFVKDAPQDYIEKQRPLLNMIRKAIQPGGVIKNPILINQVTGVSNKTLYSSQSISPLNWKRYDLTKTMKVVTSSLDYEAMVNAAGDQSAVINLLSEEMRANIATHYNRIHIDLYQDGSGVIADVESVSGNVVTFTQSTDLVRVTNDMSVNFFASRAKNSAAVGGSTPTQFRIAAIDIASRKLTLDQAATGISPGYVMTLHGEKDIAAFGLKTWIPAVAPVAGDNVISGLDRSVNVQALAGHRYNAAGGSIKEAIGVLASQIYGFAGVGADTLFIHPVKAQELRMELQSQIVYEELSVNDSINGFDVALQVNGFRVPTPHGVITVVEDYAQDFNLAHLLKVSTWSILSAKGIAVWDDLDGDILRKEGMASDANYFRSMTNYNLVCTKPGVNGVLVF